MSIDAVLAPGPRQELDRRGIGILSLTHGCIDLSNGAVPALLPFFIIERGATFAETTALILAVTISSSILQPLFGHLTDVRPMSWLMPAGLAVAGLGISLVGVTEQFWLTFLLINLVGVGSAAFHPEAARYANYVSGSVRARGMSLFSVGGNTGFAFGPILVTPLALTFGLEGTLLLLVPFTAFTVLLIWALPYLASFAPMAKSAAAGAGHAAEETDRWGPFWLLAVVSSLRSGVYFGMQAFIPAYFIVSFAASAGEANAALTLLLVCGALGTLVGGWLGDRLGLKQIMMICLAVLPPLILAVLISGQTVAYGLIALVGFFTVGTFSPSVVMGQQLLPNRIGIASGVTLGAAIGAGGAIAGALGPLADAAGLETVIVILALLPIPALLLAIPLPGRGLWPRPRRG